MASIVGKRPTRRVDQRPNAEGDQRNNSSENDPPTTPTPASNQRLLIWILRILIVLFVLNRSLNQTLGMRRPNLQGAWRNRDGFWQFGHGRDGFDHFVLNMNWPVTIAAKGMKDDSIVDDYDPLNPTRLVTPERLLNKFYQKPGNLRFTIHGLWPNSRTGQPKNCYPDRILGYDEHDVSRIRGIVRYWPSFLKTNAKFWKEQWLKHGRCATPHPQTRTYATYFRKAIELAEGLSGIQEEFADEYLQLEGGDYDHGTPSELHTLHQFFTNHHGNHVRINYQRFKVIYLSHIYIEKWVESVSFCYDLEFHAINCPLTENYEAAVGKEIIRVFVPKQRALGSVLEIYNDPI